MKEIAIAVCFDENYALNGAMVLYSAAKNIEKNVKIRAYIVDGGISEKTKKRFNRILRNNLNIIWLNPDLSMFDNLSLSSWTTKVAHARLLLPYIIKDDIKKIIYLDSDILVIDNIFCLWEVNLNNYLLAAFQDTTYTNVYKKVNSQVLIEAGMNRFSPYFNSGFLLLNKKLCGDENILKDYIEILKSIGNKFTHCNQDAMNIIFKNKWVKLNREKQYEMTSNNYFCKKNKKLKKNLVFIHYTGKTPGFPGCKHPKKNIFYYYVYNSKWFSKKEFITWRSKILINDFYNSIFVNCFKKIKKFYSLFQDIKK
jgi:lipopolysaccharide biosynthesis glycosyltransferase